MLSFTYLLMAVMTPCWGETEEVQAPHRPRLPSSAGRLEQSLRMLVFLKYSFCEITALLLLGSRPQPYHYL